MEVIDQLLCPLWPAREEELRCIWEKVTVLWRRAPRITLNELEQSLDFQADYLRLCLERLEAIVEALEEGGLSLDESLKRFEEGIHLSRRCEKALTEAEKRIEILVKNAEGKLEPQPFGEPSPEAPASGKPADPPKENDEGADEGGLLF